MQHQRRRRSATRPTARLPQAKYQVEQSNFALRTRQRSAQWATQRHERRRMHSQTWTALVGTCREINVVETPVVGIDTQRCRRTSTLECLRHRYYTTPSLDR